MAGYRKGMPGPGARDDDAVIGAASAGPAPIAILDFLANAESVVQRLGDHTNVPDWILTRRLGDEWVVLAGHGRQGFRPGDVLDRTDGTAERLSALADAWERDLVVDLDRGHVEPHRPAMVVDDDLPLSSGALMAFPLWGGDGLFGAICALPTSADQLAHLQQTTAIVRLTVELLTSVLDLDLDRSRLQRRVDAAESAALSDPLTSLGNRRAFDLAIDREEARCARFGHLAGVMVMDLDGLKRVNDTSGHVAGDELLRRAAATIRATLRGSDQAFRIGGDEFALLLPEISMEGLGALHDRLISALADAGVAASIGCAVRRPGGANLHTCARAADAAMYARKRERADARREVRGRSHA